MTEPKKRGRPVGAGAGVKIGTRPGSRPWQIERMPPGSDLFLRAPAGRAQAFMQQVAADIGRVEMNGVVAQSLILGVELATREVYEIVRLHKAV